MNNRIQLMSIIHEYMSDHFKLKLRQVQYNVCNKCHKSNVTRKDSQIFVSIRELASQALALMILQLTFHIDDYLFLKKNFIFINKQG